MQPARIPPSSILYTAGRRTALEPALSSPASTPRADTGSARELRLKRGEERRLSSGHLWVFSNEIDSDATPLAAFAPGDLAQIKSQRGQFLGYAYVNPHALICARILSRDPAHPIDRALLDTRLRAALTLRERLYRDPYYRLVFGESDGLPGLVLDRYGDVLVGQIATAGMEALKETVAEAVRALLSPAVLYWKNDSAARQLEQLPQVAATAFGEAPGGDHRRRRPACASRRR